MAGRVETRDGLEGVRGGDVRRAGEAAEAAGGEGHQGRAARLLAPNLRPELRRATSNILRHVGPPPLSLSSYIV